jgi:hypothetical protein
VGKNLNPERVSLDRLRKTVSASILGRTRIASDVHSPGGTAVFPEFAWEIASPVNIFVPFGHRGSFTRTESTE